LIALVVIGFVAFTRFLLGKPSGKYVPRPTEMARIIEQVRFTLDGWFAIGMLLLFNVVAIPAALLVVFGDVGMIFSFYDVLIWIGWNILWGIVAILGRRRTYIVHRTVHPER
jgi:hypothetical protein